MGEDCNQVCRLQGSAAPHRLAEVVDNMGSSDMARNIDDLYGQVMYTSFSTITAKERDVAKFVLAAISMAKAPLRIQDLVEFLAYEGNGKKDVVRFVIGVLSPIINVGEADQLLQVCHKTLSDFLLDESRTQEVFKQLLKRGDDGDLVHYMIRRSEQGSRLVESCLRLMNDKLTFNICRIPTSHCFNDAPPIRNALAANPIPSHLVYACRYWAEHLDALGSSTSQSSDSILHPLKDFLFTHILHWLEVLSLTSSADRAPYLLSCAEKYTEVRLQPLTIIYVMYLPWKNIFFPTEMGKVRQALRRQDPVRPCAGRKSVFNSIPTAIADSAPQNLYFRPSIFPYAIDDDSNLRPSVFHCFVSYNRQTTGLG